MLGRKRPTIQEFVAVNDTFGESATPAELMKKYGIDSDAFENYEELIYFEIYFKHVVRRVFFVKKKNLC